MTDNAIFLELISERNMDQVRRIQRDDVSEESVDSADTILELTQYGFEHHLIGYTFAVRIADEYSGLILLGEAIEWEIDPDEMKGNPFYRLMGFVIDKRYRNCGIGGYVLEKTIEKVHADFGVRSIALGVYKDNFLAERFYVRHGFLKTDFMEGNDDYYLRYPK